MDNVYYFPIYATARQLSLPNPRYVQGGETNLDPKTPVLIRSRDAMDDIGALFGVVPWLPVRAYSVDVQLANP